LANQKVSRYVQDYGRAGAAGPPPYGLGNISTAYVHPFTHGPIMPAELSTYESTHHELINS
jgi:hypothetical protein